MQLTVEEHELLDYVMSIHAPNDYVKWCFVEMGEDDVEWLDRMHSRLWRQAAQYEKTHCRDNAHDCFSACLVIQAHAKLMPAKSTIRR